MMGGLLFGAGWGLAGFCPGLALVAAGAGAWQAIVFTLAMLADMAISELGKSLQRPAPCVVARPRGVQPR